MLNKPSREATATSQRQGEVDSVKIKLSFQQTFINLIRVGWIRRNVQLSKGARKFAYNTFR